MRSRICGLAIRAGHALLRGDPISLIFGVTVLITGSIWRAAPGPLVGLERPDVVLVPARDAALRTYQPLRFAIEDPERQARYASVFAITAGAFVPINFAIVRLAPAYVHPRTLSNISGNLPGRMQVVFYLALFAITLL